VSRLRDVAEKKSRQSKSVTATLHISFTPNDRTIRLMQSFHFVIKVKGGRGASSSSPITRLLEATRDSRKVRAQTPWGKGCTELRCTPQAARRGGYACLTNIPLSIPGLYIITYKCVNCYHFCGQISLQEKLVWLLTRE